MCVGDFEPYYGDIFSANPKRQPGSPAETQKMGHELTVLPDMGPKSK